MIKRKIKELATKENLQLARILANPIKLYDTLKLCQEFINRNSKINLERDHESKLVDAMNEIGLPVY